MGAQNPPPFGLLYLDTGPVIINEITKHNHITITAQTPRDLPIIPIILNQQFNKPLSTGISTLVETHTNQAIDTARTTLSNDYTIFTTQLQTQMNIVTTQLNNKFTQLEKQREEDLLNFKTARGTCSMKLS